MTQPTTSLFREEALKHYLQAEEGRGLVETSPPWTWALLWLVVSALVAAAVASVAGRVEVNARGRGILRPAHGIRLLVSQAGGVVGALEVRSGQAVKAGTVLARIEVPQVLSQSMEAERQVEAVRKDYQALSARQDAAHAEQARRLAGRIQQLREQVGSLRESIGLCERKLQAKQKLHAMGLSSSFEVDDAREALALANRQLGAGLLALDQAGQERAALDARRQEELWQRKVVVQNAEIRRDSLAFLEGQILVRAPEDGVVEALLVRPGEVVQPGQAVGKLIPQGSPLQVVSFLDEKDRAFLRPGDAVHLELEQLPYAEYGTLRARIARISDDLASPFEIREALGEDQKLEGPAFRVELDLTDTRALERANVKLRPGMLMRVRYTLRRQRLVTILLDPLRRWFR